jgi:hypothetical protein
VDALRRYSPHRCTNAEIMNKITQQLISPSAAVAGFAWQADDDASVFFFLAGR